MAKTKAKKVKKEIKKDVKKAISKAVKKTPKKIKPKLAIKGRGGYWSDLGRSVGGGIGGVADGILGLGKAITGVGDYSIKSNSLMETAGPPRIRNTKHQSIVHHEEYLCDIKGSINFAIQQFPINPGVTTTFPWLASQASAYEQWKPRGIIFSFRSSCGDAVSSTDNAEGMVIMATEYNSNLPAFTSKQEMEEHEYVTSFKPSVNGLHGIECAKSLTPLNQLYIRSGSSNGSNSQNYNPLSYDLGQFYVATQGMQVDDVTIGELWVSYELELLKPTLTTTISTNIYQHWYWDSTLGPAPISTAMFRNLRNVNTGETTSSSANVLPGFQPGRYLVSMFAVGAAVTFPAVINFDVTNGTVLPFTVYSNLTNANTASEFIPVGGGTAASATYGFQFSAVGSIKAPAVTLTTLTQFDIHVTPIGNGLSSKSRRAVDWDPFARISRRIDDLAALLGRERQFPDEYKIGSENYSRISHPEWSSYNRGPAVSVEPQAPVDADSPVLVRSPEIADLSRSQVDFATSLLNRLSARGLTSKTGSVQAA